MAAPRFSLPYAQPVNANGVPLAGAKLYFYASGTSTPLDTYNDSGRTITNANPVVADSAGRFPAIFLKPQAYKTVLKTAGNVTIRVDDPVSTLGDLADMIYAPGYTGAISRTAAEKLAEFISVKDFGAKGDGTTNDTSAIQAAISYAISVGCNLRIPAGRYVITSQLTVDESAVTTEDATKIWITGDGNGSSVIVSQLSTGTALYLSGGASNSGAGMHSYQKVAGLRFEGNGSACAIGGENLAYVKFEDISITGFADGFSFSDILSAVWLNCIVRGVTRGFTADRNYTAGNSGDYESNPNNLTFIGCTFGLCSTWGVKVNGGATLNFLGGSIEGCGSGSTGHAGVILTNAGVEGAAGCAVVGTYFEGNWGDADVIIDQGDTGAGPIGNGSTYAFTGCTFNRPNSPATGSGGPHYTTHCILFRTNNQPGALSVTGCGFKEYPGANGNAIFLPSGAIYIKLPTSGSTWTAEQSGNYFFNDDLAPRWSKLPSSSAVMSGGQTITNGTLQKVNFTSEQWDYGLNFDSANGEFVAPCSGLYHVSAAVYFPDLGAAGDASIVVSWYDTSAGTWADKAGGGVGGVKSGTAQVSTILPADRGDRFKVSAYQASGADRALSTDSSYTFFRVWRA